MSSFKMSFFLLAVAEACLTLTAAMAQQADPNDPEFHKQWYLKKNQPNQIDIGITGAWQRTHGPAVGSLNHVAMVDGGSVDVDHPDLIWPSGQHRVLSNLPGYADMHSTNVAGIIAAVTNNDSGVAGIDWNSKLDAIDATHNTDGPTPESVRDNLIFLTNHDYKVINHSYGNPSASMGDIVVGAFVYSYNHDVVNVAAMGNDGLYGTWYPAALPGVLAVGSVKWNGERAEQSNMGPYIDLVAPSANMNMPNEVEKIYTTNAGGGYGYWWGTSLATPQVTGVVSLLRAYRPDLSNDDVEWILKYSAWDPPMSPQGPDSAYGYGLIQADSAFALLELPYTFDQDSVVGAEVVSISGLDDVYFEWPPEPGLHHYQGRKLELRVDARVEVHWFYSGQPE